MCIGHELLVYVEFGYSFMSVNTMIGMRMMYGTFGGLLRRKQNAKN